MKIKLSKIVSCTLVCTGVLSAIGAGMYARTQASDSDLDVSLSAVTPTAASDTLFTFIIKILPQKRFQAPGSFPSHI